MKERVLDLMLEMAMDSRDDDGVVVLRAATCRQTRSGWSNRKGQRTVNEFTSRLRKINFGWSLTEDVNDKEKIRALIEQLSFWNDGLREVLPVRERQFNSIISQVRSVSILDDPKDLKVIEEACDGLYGPIYQNIKAGCRMKCQRLLQDEIMDGPSSFQKPLEKATLVDSKWRSSERDLLLTTFSMSGKDFDTSGTRVLIEFTNIRRILAPEDTQVLEHRIQGLSSLLRVEESERPSSLFLPLCKGYLKEGPSNFALIYELPSFADPLRRPRSLYSIFPRNECSVRRPGQLEILPFLEQRFSLASALAQGLLQLHSIHWLHKDLNSDNVLLFHGPSGLQITKPMMSGFGLGRAASPEQRTIDLRGVQSKFDLYQHPNLRSEAHRRYERRYDIYSLGMILFEIGVWENLHYLSTERQTPEEFRRRVVNECHTRLGHLMGEGYRTVVLTCIDNDDIWKNAEGGDDPSAILEILSWKVVRELQRCGLIT